jgi:two-component system, OmpR family, phosphate regulon sensor histidine kinase PhoR
MTLLDFTDLAGVVGDAVDAGATVPLLVLRQPELERIAWREGKRRARIVERRTVAAFRGAAARIVRDGDALAHASGSDRFAVAMLAPARAGRPAGSSEARAALERIGAAMSLSTGRQMETGWWPVGRRAEVEAFATTIDAALERGARERERCDLLATVGHELRTPLTSIRGYIETLLDEDVDRPTARRFLETTRREALRLGRLVDGMLEFSMLDLSTGVSSGCDVVEQIEATVEAIAPLAHERGITIHTRLPRVAVARIEPDACVHALVNLVENAVKYGRDGGRIEVTCVREAPFVCIAVDDDGPGVGSDEWESIFRMGVRGGGACRPGTGIGLAIVKAIVDRAGGDARVVASTLGGARFAVRIPEVPEFNH